MLSATEPIENYNNADNDFSKCLITLLELPSRAVATVKGSHFQEKRKLINMVFENLKLKGHRLEFTLRPPFDGFVKCAKNGEWWARQDLNLRPLRYERSALTN